MKNLAITGILALALAGLSPATLAGHHSKSGKNIVETAASAGNFSTLIAAAKAAGLVGALTGDGPLTVFAPTDEAFGALPAGTIETLLKPENKDQLARILKYHVVAGRVGSGALEDGIAIDTLAGATALIQQTENGFNIQGARIVATDIDASNGVVHVIDRVILPPETMSRRGDRNDAADLIGMAIELGVPMFNHGNPEATKAIYTMAVESLMRFAELSPEQAKRLERGLNQSRHSSSARDSAWQLRYALDEVNESLHQQSMNARMSMR